MLLKEKIRSTVGVHGMMIYTPDQSQVCIAYDKNGDGYTIKNEPACLWEGKEEIFHSFCSDSYVESGMLSTLIRLTCEIMFALFFPMILRNFFDVPIRICIGFYFFTYSFIYLFEFSILNGLYKRKTEIGQAILRWQGALNKAINAFEEHHRPPLQKEIEQANIYRHDKDRYMKPHESVGILFAFLSVPFFMPTITLSVISIPVAIFLTILAYQTSFFGLLKLTSVAKPTKHELQMAESLMEYWFSISYKNTLKSYK